MTYNMVYFIKMTTIYDSVDDFRGASMEGLEQLRQHLVPKLAERGMAPGAIPLFIRGLATSIDDHPDGNPADINLNLRRLGWDGFDMDSGELKVVRTCLGASGLRSLRQKPARWFFKEFEPPASYPSRLPSLQDAETDPAFNKEIVNPAASS